MSNVLSDSLSRLSYYDLYEKPKPEKPGFEFGKPKVEVSEDMYKPLKQLTKMRVLVSSH